MKRGVLRRLVIERDERCVILLADASHVCRDRWGEPHRPDDQDKLTLEHVREHAGGRRRDELGWCVATCYDANAGSHEASHVRGVLRVYLAGIRAQTRFLGHQGELVVESARRCGA